MSLASYFTFNVSDADETDLVLVSLHDSRTNYTLRTALPNSGKQTASIMAFAGARYSRASITATELFKEIKDAKKDANERLSTIFRSYGHASVADMAQLFAYIENLPQIHACRFYNETSVGGGQERSTRYQDFSGAAIDPLSQNLPVETYQRVKDTQEFDRISRQYEELQSLALHNYRKYVDLLTTKFTEVYEVDTNDKKQVGALTARVFDSARYFLPFGACNRTSICWISSAREWARIISQFKSAGDYSLNCLGEQLEVLFAPEPEVAEAVGYYPEAPDLIRYTTADETTADNLLELQAFLDSINFTSTAKLDNEFGFKPAQVKLLDSTTTSGTKVVAQNILGLYPTLDEDWLLSWLNDIPTDTKKTLGSLIFRGFDHHQQMGNQFRVNTESFILQGSIAEGRDLNRHRAWGRYIPMLSDQSDSYDILEAGYTLPLYLVENPLLAGERIEFEKDLNDYYSKLRNFASSVRLTDWFPEFLIRQLLPFGHVMKMWFHGSPKEISYLTKLRVRPGGHINYRFLAWEMARLASGSYEFLGGLDLGDDKKPDASSRAEFLDRG